MADLAVKVHPQLDPALLSEANKETLTPRAIP